MRDGDASEEVAAEVDLVAGEFADLVTGLRGFGMWVEGFFVEEVFEAKVFRISVEKEMVTAVGAVEEETEVETEGEKVVEEPDFFEDFR